MYQSTLDNKDYCTNELTMTMLRSDDFIIYTKEIADLERSIMEIVMLGNCGACVVSRPRCGKTTSMVYISHSLKEHYRARADRSETECGRFASQTRPISSAICTETTKSEF